MIVRAIAMVLAGTVFAGVAAALGWIVWYALAWPMELAGAPGFIIVMWSVAMAIASAVLFAGAMIHFWEATS